MPLTRTRRLASRPLGAASCRTALGDPMSGLSGTVSATPEVFMRRLLTATAAVCSLAVCLSCESNASSQDEAPIESVRPRFTGGEGRSRTG